MLVKKKVITIGSVILVLLILFIPIPHGTYRDGGTKDYCALTYRVVEWNRFIYEYEFPDNILKYHNTTVFLFPNNFKSLDELWEREKSGNFLDPDYIVEVNN